MKVTVLAGGVGAARFLAGLASVMPARDITAICNVGDDLQWNALHVSPDIDTVIYTLAGIEGEHGWGIRGDTTEVLNGMRDLREEAWFTVGDRDLATHVYRTSRLRAGARLSQVTRDLAQARGVEVHVLPVTDDPHPTVVRTAEGDLEFQDYFVRKRASVPVLGFTFPGAARARPAGGVLEAIGSADVLVLAPSNPFVSIDPILRVPGVRDAVERTAARRVAVSPIVGGQAVKGPAADMLRALGHEVSALGVARLYRRLVDLFVVDEVDRALVHNVRALGFDSVAADTMMTDAQHRAQVAAAVLKAAKR